jgi:hypothetical protein
MTQNIDLEIKVIKKFVDKLKQDRYIQFILSTKNRHKFIADLSHFNFLQLDKFDKVKGIEIEVVNAALQKKKIFDKTCYVISENKEIDTKNLDIETAMIETVGYGMGTILVFGKADVIFYECETMNTRYISKEN